MKEVLIFISLILYSTNANNILLVSREFQSKIFSESEVQNWKIKGNVLGRQISSCEDVTLFGGFDVFGEDAQAQKSYNSQADHQEVLISFDLFLIDSWVFDLKTSSTDITSLRVDCGNPVHKFDRINKVSFSVPHFRRDFTIRLASNLNEQADNESWGIRNLEILAKYDLQTNIVIAEEFLDINTNPGLQGWDSIGNNKNNIFQVLCDKYQIYGGPSIFGRDTIITKTFQSLQDHFALVFNFDIWFIDQFSPQDHIELTVDGQQHILKRPDQFLRDEDNSICDQLNHSRIIAKYSILIPHIDPQFTVTFKAQLELNLRQSSFGFKSFKVFAQVCRNGCFLNSTDLTSPQFDDVSNFFLEGGKMAPQAISNFNNFSYFGGLVQTVYKTYNDLVQHQKVKIFLKILTSGTSSSSISKSLQVLIDNVQARVEVAKSFEQIQLNDNIGNLRYYQIEGPHTSADIQLRIIFDKPIANTNYLIRDIKIMTYSDSNLYYLFSEFTDYDFTIADWTVRGGNIEIRANNCGPIRIFGGYKTFGSKTNATKILDRLPPHNYVLINLEVFLLDTWELNENLTFKIDDSIAYVLSRDTLIESQQNLCAQLFKKDDGYSLSFHYPHTHSNLTITIIDNLKDLLVFKYWGLRNIYVYIDYYQILPQISQNQAQDNLQCNLFRNQTEK